MEYKLTNRLDTSGGTEGRGKARQACQTFGFGPRDKVRDQLLAVPMDWHFLVGQPNQSWANVHHTHTPPVYTPYEFKPPLRSDRVPGKGLAVARPLGGDHC